MPSIYDPKTGDGGLTAKARALPDMDQVAARRAMRSDFGPSLPAAARSDLADVSRPDVPAWLVTEDYFEIEHGVIKSGKEATVNLVERYSPKGNCLLARKRYKGQSERSFQRDQIYREGRKFKDSRLRRAVEHGTALGRAALKSDWHENEYLVLTRLFEAGVNVPYPVGFEGTLLMQYIGDEERAAPRLFENRPSGLEAEGLSTQILSDVRKMAREGIVHGDLSAYNILVWNDAAWIIDFPQAVEIGSNQHAPDLLRRDVFNVVRFFERRGVVIDAEEQFALCIAELYSTS